MLAFYGIFLLAFGRAMYAENPYRLYSLFRVYIGDIKMLLIFFFLAIPSLFIWFATLTGKVINGLLADLLFEISGQPSELYDLPLNIEPYEMFIKILTESVGYYVLLSISII